MKTLLAPSPQRSGRAAAVASFACVLALIGCGAYVTAANAPVVRHTFAFDTAPVDDERARVRAFAACGGKSDAATPCEADGPATIDVRVRAGV